MRLPRLVPIVSALGVLAGGAAAAALPVPGVAVASSPGAQQPPRLVLMDDAEELDAVLAGKSSPRDVSVRVAGVSLPDADPAKARLLIVAEISDRAVVGQASVLAGQVGQASVLAGPPAFRLASVAYVVENERGQAVARALRRRELAWTAAGTLAFSETVALPPGTYRVKVAALRNGRLGGAQANADARVRAVGALRFGDVVVGEAAGEDLGGSLAFDKQIRGDRLVASMALAGGGQAAEGLSVTVDVSKDPSSPAMMSAPAALLASEDTVRVAQAVVDVRALPAGDYVARAVITVAGKEAARFAAPFHREPSASAAPAAAGTPARTRGGTTAPGAAGGFVPDDVLATATLAPFLDDLAARASAQSKPAIEQARAGRFAEAAAAAASAGASDPAKPFLLGLSLFAQKQLQDASEAFRETLRAAPDYFAGAFYIGACYAAGGRDTQAINAWQTSLVGLEDYPVVFRLLADAQARTGQPGRALETMEEAAAKWPSDPLVRARTARAALEAKRYERVIALVDGAPSGQPTADLLFVGMQAVYEQATASTGAPREELVSRARRYRDAYAAAGGPQQALVAEWASAVERKK